MLGRTRVLLARRHTHTPLTHAHRALHECRGAPAVSTWSRVRQLPGPCFTPRCVSGEVYLTLYLQVMRDAGERALLKALRRSPEIARGHEGASSSQGAAADDPALHARHGGGAPRCRAARGAAPLGRLACPQARSRVGEVEAVQDQDRPAGLAPAPLSAPTSLTSSSLPRRRRPRRRLRPQARLLESPVCISPCLPRRPCRTTSGLCPPPPPAASPEAARSCMSRCPASTTGGTARPTGSPRVPEMTRDDPRLGGTARPTGSCTASARPTRRPHT